MIATKCRKCDSPHRLLTARNSSTKPLAQLRTRKPSSMRPPARSQRGQSPLGMTASSMGSTTVPESIPHATAVQYVGRRRHSLPIRPCHGSGPGSRPVPPPRGGRGSGPSLPHGQRIARHLANQYEPGATAFRPAARPDRSRRGSTLAVRPRCRPSRSCRRGGGRAEGAAGEAGPRDVDEIDPAGMRLDLGLRSHPAQDLFRIGQEGEHRRGWRWDVRLAALLSHCCRMTIGAFSD
jgi:hypothetical protein